VLAVRAARPSTAAIRAVCATLLVGLAIALLLKAFSGIDLRATGRAIEGAGAWAPLALLPFVAAMTLDSVGIKILLGTLGRRVTLGQLLPIRIATEALHLTAPAGFVVADSATAALLDSRCGVPVSEGAVLAIARKWLVMRAHSLYIATGALLGASVLATVSVPFLGGHRLAWAVGLSALVPLSLSVAMGAGFRGQPLVLRLQAALGKLPWPALRARVARWRSGAAAVDDKLARVGDARAATWKAAAAYLSAWLMESLETAILIKLVGGPLDLAFAMGAEVGISMLRSIGNVAPAGLGVQDAGYAVLFEAMGLPPHTTAAFVLLKRGKELVWIGVGYVLLAAMRRPAPTMAGVGVAATNDSVMVPGVAGAAPLRALFTDSGRPAPRQPAL
jgi:glycosyltransferase 2 family protein